MAMASQGPGPVLKLRTAHESVGWLGEIAGVTIISECDNPECGCHEGAKEAKKQGIPFLHFPLEVSKP